MSLRAAAALWLAIFLIALAMLCAAGCQQQPPSVNVNVRRPGPVVVPRPVIVPVRPWYPWWDPRHPHWHPYRPHR